MKRTESTNLIVCLLGLSFFMGCGSRKSVMKDRSGTDPDGKAHTTQVQSEPVKLSKRKLPPGQTEIDYFPILHIADIPDLSRENWRLKITGEVSQEVELDWPAFAELESIVVESDFHCVNGWTYKKNRWEGVLLLDLISLAKPLAAARFISFFAADGYHTSLPIDLCTGEHDLLAFSWEKLPLDTERGGPVRVLLADRYGYKSAMWVIEIRLTEKQETGYWEEQGYHPKGNVWEEQRYKSGEK